MTSRISWLLFGGLCLACTLTYAQPPQGKRPGGPPDRPPRQDEERDVDSRLERALALDQNNDGALTADEVTGQRLRSLLKRADANSDESVTREELTAFFEKESNARPPRSGRRGDVGPPRGPEGPGRFGPPQHGGPEGPPPHAGPRSAGPQRMGPPEGRPPQGAGHPAGPPRGPEGPGQFGPPRHAGPEGPPPHAGPRAAGPQRTGPPEGRPPQGAGHPAGPPRPGQILPPFLHEELGLSQEQIQQLEALQQQVDQQLADILTSEQNERLRHPGPPEGAAPGRRGEWGPPQGGFPGKPAGRPPRPDREGTPESKEAPVRLP